MEQITSQMSPPVPEPAERLVDTFNEIRRELLGALFGLLGNQEDAQDVLQIAFINCWQARTSMGEVQDLRAWIWRICINAGKDMLRNAWRRRARPLDHASSSRCSAGPCPVSSAMDREKRQRLLQELQALRAEEREVFLLRQNAALTWEEIAHIRECPVGTVKTQLRSAVTKLRRVLRQWDKEKAEFASEEEPAVPAVLCSGVMG